MGETPQWLHIIIQVSLGVSLSACAGLRAFLPLLALAILARTGYIHVGHNFEWIGSTPTLIVFSAAALTEIIGDKFPAVDHFLDSSGFVIKPIAGTILFSTVIIKMDPLLAVALGIMVGGSISELIHVKKASLRVASSGFTAGMANPIISVLEDAGTAAGVAVSFIAPILGAIVVLFGIYAAFRIYRKILDKSKETLALKERKAMVLDMAGTNTQEQVKS